MERMSLRNLMLLGKGGGGASNVATGTFKGTESGAMDVTIPYKGDGYPVAGIVFPTGGSWKDESAIASLAQKYVVIWAAFAKNDFSLTPNYSSATAQNNGELFAEIKNSDENADSVSSLSKTKKNIYYDANASQYSDTFMRIRANKKMSVYIASTSYGFAKDIEYTYCLLYSE